MGATTPLWVPLVVAVLGLLATAGGAITGVLITQRRSDKRDDKTWERERQREQERWTREDAARTFEQRRAAYTDFYEALRVMGLTIFEHGVGTAQLVAEGEPPHLPPNYQQDAYARLQHLQIYASVSVSTAASIAYGTCWEWGSKTTYGRDNGELYQLEEDHDDAMKQLLVAIRNDLAVPDKWTAVRG